ncbi:MAG TPA: biotin/lipoyl-binding protein, partial [Candidatus Obscuribacter sp.]|nr:biotin/lipoyl-binding protein [Candidatus Obscuribacter sp.]
MINLDRKNDFIDGVSASTRPPRAYQSLKTVRSAPAYGTVALFLCLILIGIVLMLAYVPWQQTISGTGKIMILCPMERPQNIEALIPARLKQWHVRDGETVKKGQLVAELTDIDSKFLDPNQVSRIEGQRKALEGRREAARSRYKALGNQLESLKRSQGAAVPSASEKSKQAKDRIWAAGQAVEAAKQNTVTTQLNLN